MISLTGLTVLIVDDEDWLREALADHFQLFGATTLTSGGGVDAMNALLNQKVDVVISDVRMPNGNGVEFCQNINSDSRLSTKPIVFLISGFYDLDQNAIAALKVVKGVLNKPFEVKQLIELVYLELKKK